VNSSKSRRFAARQQLSATHISDQRSAPLATETGRIETAALRLADQPVNGAPDQARDGRHEPF
jgi:hypothetical protein